MKNIKKYIVLLMIAILVLGMNAPTAYASSVSVTIGLSASEVNVGDGVTVTINISGSDVVAITLYVSYDSSILQFNSGSGSCQVGGGGGSLTLSGAGGGSTNLSFTAIGAGTSYVGTSGSEAYDIDLNTIPISHGGVSVSVVSPNSGNNTTEAPSTEAPSSSNNTTQSTTEAQDNNDDGKSDNAFLYSLSINPGTLDPEFSPYTTSYSAQVDEDVTKISVSAQADDNNAGVSVWGANELEPGENLVQVAVTAENGDVRYYDIHVMVGEDVGTPFTEIDGVRYGFIDYEDGLEPPEGFESTTLKYEKWQVLAYKAPNDKLHIVPLVAEESDEDSEDDVEYEWYMYLEDKNCFVKYQEYTSRYNRYVIMDVPEGVEVPEGYKDADITINGNKVNAYQPDKEVFKDYDANSKMYLVYAMNIEGDAGFYNYDLAEDTFLRYVPLTIVQQVVVEATPTEATPEDATPTNAIPASELKGEGFFTKEVITYILFGVSGLLLVFIIVVICLGCKNKNLKDELEDAESMVHQLAGTEPPEKKSKKSQSAIADVDLFAKDNAEGDATAQEATPEYAPEMTAINEAIDAAIESPAENVTENVPQQETMTLDELPVVDYSEDPKIEIPQIEDVDYEKKSEEINNKIKADYDAFLDSAFSDGDISDDVGEVASEANSESASEEISNEASENTSVEASEVTSDENQN